MNKVEAYEYEGKIFRTKEEVEQYKERCIEEKIEKAIYYSEYNEEKVISLNELTDILKEVPNKKLIEILKMIAYD